MTAIPKSSLKSFRAVAKRLFGRARNGQHLAFGHRDTRRACSPFGLERRGTRIPRPRPIRAGHVRRSAGATCRVRGQIARTSELRAVTRRRHDPVARSRHPPAGVLSKAVRRTAGVPGEARTALDHGCRSAPALADATDTTDPESSRYALGCVCLRGESKSIAATDGRQLLVQRGCEFPWSGDRLIPASPVFRSRELAANGPVTIGATDQHVAIGSDSWTVWLPINKDGRFPKIDDNIRADSTAKSRLSLALADAEFLPPRLDSLPADHDFNSPITLDLNGHVTVRAWAEEQPRPLELLLSNSSTSGEPVSICMNRQYLNLSPILRQAIATLAITSIAKCAALQMRCILGRLKWLLTAVENGGAGEVSRRSKLAAHMCAPLRVEKMAGVSPYLPQPCREAPECDLTWSSGRRFVGGC